MNRTARSVLAGLALAATASLAFAATAQDGKPAAPKAPPTAPKAPAAPPAQPKAPTSSAPTPAAPPAAKEGAPALPPGWTEADMQACMAAGTVGPMHEHLAQAIGTWAGKCTMWMSPGAPPMKSECKATVTGMLDGRFTRMEVDGEMPEMGPFHGFGLFGFDNTTQKFQATWVDNCSTAMMVGTGELSSDGKTMTWLYGFTCPITKKPAVLREVDRITGKDGRTVEMFGTDPKSGKEYKMGEIVYTRVAAAPAGTAVR